MFCHQCGKELKETSKFCPHCGAGAYDPAQPEALILPPPEENLPLGILGACIGSLLGGGAIVLCSLMGVFPAFAGAVLSAATVMGYDLLGKKRGSAGTVIVCLLILGVPYLAQTLGWALLAQAAWEMEYSLFRAVSFYYSLLLTGYIDISMYAQELIVLYGFTALGAAAAFSRSHRRTKKASIG